MERSTNPSTDPVGAHRLLRANDLEEDAVGMVLEVALIDVRPGQEEAFTAAYAEARPLLDSSPGCRSVRMTRGIESPGRFALLVEWASLEHHTEGFRNSDRFTRWRALIGPYFAAPPTVEHFTDVAPTPPGTTGSAPA